MARLLNILIISQVVAIVAFAPNKSTTTQTITATPSTTTRTTQLYNNLWGEPPNKDGQGKEMSKSLPFIARPKLLDGSLPGDVGFE
jgi:hypothetical protein